MRLGRVTGAAIKPWGVASRRRSSVRQNTNAANAIYVTLQPAPFGAGRTGADRKGFRPGMEGIDSGDRPRHGAGARRRQDRQVFRNRGR